MQCAPSAPTALRRTIHEMTPIPRLLHNRPDHKNELWPARPADKPLPNS